jgi:8-oxo-dGTP pyrophosphatase MutT (NUDIX family)
MKKSKQPFTIGGSVALKKALLEETGYSADVRWHEQNYLTPSRSNPNIRIIGIHGKKDVHYHLPEEYNEALQAVKDFFAEEPKPFHTIYTSEDIFKMCNNLSAKINDGEIKSDDDILTWFNQNKKK